MFHVGRSFAVPYLLHQMVISRMFQKLGVWCGAQSPNFTVLDLIYRLSALVFQEMRIAESKTALLDMWGKSGYAEVACGECKLVTL